MTSLTDTPGRLGRRLTRRIADWWSNDPTTARFAVAREHDRHVLRRHNARL
jgi:hypothetical protein